MTHHTSRFISTALVFAILMAYVSKPPIAHADCVPGNQVDSSFFSDVLTQMSISPSQFGLDAFMQWVPYEYTVACWNPLATTLPASQIGQGCTSWPLPGNTAGVQQYSSKYCGEQATAITLLYTPNGSGTYYQPIRAMLSQQSFNWQAIHDALVRWIGSDAYATSLTNQWQTLWNNRGGGTALTLSWASPSNGQTITSRTVNLQANVSGGSGGVNRVAFSAKYGGNWYGVQTVYSSPWAYTWDMCNSNVPDGDIELGLEGWDNAGTHYVYSQYYTNYHITKSYNCGGGGSSVSVTSVWTTDGSDNPKSIFSPGDSIRYHGNVSNNTGSTQTAYFNWSVNGPCGSIASWSGNLVTANGTANWWLPTNVPTNACGGNYTYQLSVTYNGSTTSQSTQFTVNAPLSVSWASPSNGQTITSRAVNLQANVSGGSGGVNRVAFSAKYGGNWYGVQTVTSSPWAYTWDMCNSNVPDGDIELGLEGWDNAGTHYVYSQYYTNYHITKSYNCNPGSPDPRQEGPVSITGSLVVGGRVYFTINVKNYGTAATPAIHPYVEGYANGANFWRADGSQPGSASIQPGQTVSFQDYYDLNVSGTWTASGIYLWNNDAGTYWEPLPANGQNQQFSFSVTNSPAVTVSSIWTADQNANSRTTFVPGDSIRYTANIYNNTGSIQTIYAAWSVIGPCGSIASWSGNLDTGAGTWTWWLPSTIPSTACGGSYTYQMSVTYNGSTSSRTTSFSIALPAASNDDFTSAKIIDVTPYADHEDTTNATTASDDPSFTCGNRSQGSASVWYRFTPSSNGKLFANTSGSSYDTMLELWSGTRGNLINITCNDDYGGSLTSSIQANVTGGTTYYIEVVRYTAGLSPTKATRAPSGGGGTLNLAVFFGTNFLYLPIINR